jgi:methylmalonyl-CoA mutase N-terminal domain/subunit
MRERMQAIMAEVDAQGGIVKLVTEGAIQAKVSAQAYRHQREIENGTFRKVGVNCYQTDEKAPEMEFHPYSEQDARAQIQSLDRVRAERDAARVQAALERVQADARSGANLMPAIIEAIKAYASVGEITGVLVGVFGRFREPVGL